MEDLRQWRIDRGLGPNRYDELTTVEREAIDMLINGIAANRGLVSEWESSQRVVQVNLEIQGLAIDELNARDKIQDMDTAQELAYEDNTARNLGL